MVDEKKIENASSSTSVREQGNVSLQCPKLDETNYTTWALLMETILKAYDQEANNQSKPLMASSSSQGHGRGRGRNFNKEGGYGIGMGRGFKDKSKFRCYECGELSHFANKCTKWEDKEKGKQQESNLIYDDEPTLL
ncbi:hypothetical protein L1987_00715 [Smallanthus sonchifolius]|uniref:Uncharacterized protein n=1 Tax=Smallanthus sonchifolius TaxID=185202 RepID=A0ACB9K306_9ASTR|nr:hypothetical protein L1987_00715 [Smallanthus sonchifolius]